MASKEETLRWHSNAAAPGPPGDSSRVGLKARARDKTGAQSLAAAMAELRALEQCKRDKENVFLKRDRQMSGGRRGHERTRAASTAKRFSLFGRDDESSESDSELSERISQMQRMPLMQVLHPPDGGPFRDHPHLEEKLYRQAASPQRASAWSAFSNSNPRWRLLERAVAEGHIPFTDRPASGASERGANKVWAWVRGSPLEKADAEAARQLYDGGAKDALARGLAASAPSAIRKIEGSFGISDLSVGALSLHVRRLEEKIEGLTDAVKAGGDPRGVLSGGPGREERSPLSEKKERIDRAASTAAQIFSPERVRLTRVASPPPQTMMRPQTARMSSSVDSVLSQLQQAGDDALRLAGARIAPRKRIEGPGGEGFDLGALSWLEGADSALKLLQQVAATRVSIQLATAACWAQAPQVAKNSAKPDKKKTWSAPGAGRSKKSPQTHQCVGEGKRMTTPFPNYSVSVKPPWK